MSFPPGSFHAGLEALKQGNYQEAIRILEVCCDRALPGSPKRRGFCWPTAVDDRVPMPLSRPSQPKSGRSRPTG